MNPWRKDTPMRSLDLVLHAISDDERARLDDTASQLREPDDWNAGTRGLWRFSYEGATSNARSRP